MDIASATLSGGVAVGAVADMMIGPAVAFFSGTVMGIVSTLGFRKLQSHLNTNFGYRLDLCLFLKILNCESQFLLKMRNRNLKMTSLSIPFPLHVVTIPLPIPDNLPKISK